MTFQKLKRIKKTFVVVLTIIVIKLLTTNVNAQNLELYILQDLENAGYRNISVGLVSLSDNYILSEHPDSAAIPDLSNDSEEEVGKIEYFRLTSKYRNQFLSGMKISETDKVFIYYSYSKDILISFPVSDLNVVACLNAYTRPEKCPCPAYYYQIGFEIDKKYLIDFEDYYINTLVYVGNKNPFVKNQIKPIVWLKIDGKEFPVNLVDSIFSSRIWRGEYETRQSYKYEDEKYQYFIQELWNPIGQYKYDQIGLRRLVIDLVSNAKVYETIYYSGGESSSFAPLDNQWTGNLFKNKPPVIFGFKYHSFGCPGITFLNPNEKKVEINCDNRH